MGIRILNYLDEWLVLAQSKAKLISHRTLLLSHLECLGLRVNFTKSMQSPPASEYSSWEQFSSQLRWEQQSHQNMLGQIQKLAASFEIGTTHPLKAFQKMLGLMATASPALQLGLLRMRPLQRWLKPRVPSNAWRHGRLCIRVEQACVTALATWKSSRWME